MNPNFERISRQRSQFYVNLRTQQRAKGVFQRRFRHFSEEMKAKCTQEIREFVPDLKNLKEMMEIGFNSRTFKEIVEKKGPILSDFMWKLGLITTEITDESHIMAYRELLPVLIQLITPEMGLTASLAMWVLSNLTMLSGEICQIVVSFGVISKLMAMLESTIFSDFRGVTWTLMHILANSPCEIGLFHADWLRCLQTLQIRTIDASVSTDILFILSAITGKDPNLVPILLENDYAESVVRLLNHGNTEMRLAALKLVCVIAESTSSGALLQWGALEMLIDLLKCDNHRMILESLRALQGILTVPNRAVTKRVVSLSLISLLIHIIRLEQHLLALHGLITLSYLLQDRFWILTHSLLEQGIIPILLSVLRSRHYEQVEIALDVLRVLLEVSVEISLEQGRNEALEELVEGGAEEVLERLFSSANGEIAKAALVILERYFTPTGEDEEMDTLAMIEQYDF